MCSKGTWGTFKWHFRFTYSRALAQPAVARLRPTLTHRHASCSWTTLLSAVTSLLAGLAKLITDHLTGAP